MNAITNIGSERKIATTGPIGPQAGMLELPGANAGWNRLMHDLFADEKIGRARKAMSNAASQVDLMGETARMLAAQMLPALRA